MSIISQLKNPQNNSQEKNKKDKNKIKTLAKLI